MSIEFDLLVVLSQHQFRLATARFTVRCQGRPQGEIRLAVSEKNINSCVFFNLLTKKNIELIETIKIEC